MVNSPLRLTPPEYNPPSSTTIVFGLSSFIPINSYILFVHNKVVAVRVPTGTDGIPFYLALHVCSPRVSPVRKKQYRLLIEI